VSCEERVPQDHPLRRIRAIVDEALEMLSSEFEGAVHANGAAFDRAREAAAGTAAPGVSHGSLGAALMEQLDYDLLFRWFVGLGMDAAVWDASVFSKNRDRLLAGDLAQKFLAVVLSQKRVTALLSSEHFSVDGTLIEAWAGASSRRMAQTATGRAREAWLYRKGNGQAAELCYMGHLLMENRNGLIVGARLTAATGTAEREAALALLDGRGRCTAGMDKGYYAAAFVADLRARRVTPHIAQNTSGRRSARRCFEPVLIT
jgi:hypothetical protein